MPILTDEAEAMPSVSMNPSTLRLAALGTFALVTLGLAAAGCGSAGPEDSGAPPPVETRELDASQTQRTMQPLDSP